MAIFHRQSSTGWSSCRNRVESENENENEEVNTSRQSSLSDPPLAVPTRPRSLSEGVGPEDAEPDSPILVTPVSGGPGAARDALGTFGSDHSSRQSPRLHRICTSSSRMGLELRSAGELHKPLLNSFQADGSHSLQSASSIPIAKTNSAGSRNRSFPSGAIATIPKSPADLLLTGLSGAHSSSDCVFESFFDLTTERLAYIFKTFDRDEDGRVSYDALRQGLLHWVGLHIEDDKHFDRLVAMLDSDASRDISLEEFEDGVRLLMMQQLFANRTQPQPVPALEVLDYNAVAFRRALISSEDEMRSFMFSKRDQTVQSRWINTYGSEGSALTLKRLAVKYRLHPLALEDALTPGQRPKVDRYDTHYFLAVPLYSCDRVDAEEGHRGRLPSQRGLGLFRGQRGRVRTMDSDERWRYRLRVKSENVCIFVCFSPAYDTIITFQQGDRQNSRCWDRVLTELGKSYSKLRQYDVQFLAYVILDALVDRLTPVVQEFQAELGPENFAPSGGTFDLSWLQDLKLELQQMLRKMRPLGRLVTHIIEDSEFCEGVTLYLRDVRDNVEAVEEDLRALISRCEGLESLSEKYHSGQMENAMYRLSVISTIFLPAQFLTGVYGMNFDSMPELHWGYGYVYFWGLIVVLIFAMIMYFYCWNNGTPQNLRLASHG